MAAGTRNYDVHRRTAGRKIIELKSEKHQEFNKKKQRDKKTLRVVAGEIDYTFLFIVILVLAAGLVMLLSASAPRASEMFDGNSYYFFNRQFIFAVAGVVGMWIISRINYKRYIKYVPMMFVGSIITLILVAIPHVGTVVNGARRWLFVFQPSEVMKPVLVFCLNAPCTGACYRTSSQESDTAFPSHRHARQARVSDTAHGLSSLDPYRFLHPAPVFLAPVPARL